MPPQHIDLVLDDAIARLDTDCPPSSKELARMGLFAFKSIHSRLQEGHAIMNQQTDSLREQRGALINMRREMEELRVVVMQKHAQDLEDLKRSRDSLKMDMEAMKEAHDRSIQQLADRMKSANARVRNMLIGAGVILTALSHVNLSELSKLIHP